MRWRRASTRVRTFMSSLIVSVSFAGRPLPRHRRRARARRTLQRRRPDAGLFSVEHEQARPGRTSRIVIAWRRGSSATLVSVSPHVSRIFSVTGPKPALILACRLACRAAKCKRCKCFRRVMAVIGARAGNPEKVVAEHRYISGSSWCGQPVSKSISWTGVSGNNTARSSKTSRLAGAARLLSISSESAGWTGLRSRLDRS